MLTAFNVAVKAPVPMLCCVHVKTRPIWAGGAALLARIVLMATGVGHAPMNALALPAIHARFTETVAKVSPGLVPAAAEGQTSLATGTGLLVSGALGAGSVPTARNNAQ